MTKAQTFSSIILIGMMGSGKTTIGKALANHLNWDFYDLDHEIEKHCGTTVQTIFAVEGEVGFRRRETECLKKTIKQNNIILATGGGAVLQVENRSLLKQYPNACIIYLNAPVDELWQRLQYDRTRPLLDTENPYETLNTIYNNRHQIYERLATNIIDTSCNNIYAVLHSIELLIYERENHQF